MSDLLDLSKVIPPWINEEFLARVFKSAKISNLKVASASKPGDNFVGAVYRVNFNIDGEKRQFVLKTPSSSAADTALTYLVDDFVANLFDTEMRMYGEVLPQMQQLWMATGCADLLSPKLIHQERQPIHAILLEDVSPQGFRIMQLPSEDFEVSTMVAKRLGRFHATSFYLANEKNANFSTFNGSIFNNPLLTDVVYRLGLDAFTHVAEEQDELREYVAALQNIKATFIQKMTQIYSDRSEKHLLVLNHNDFHNKNVLFRDQDDKIVDLCFIDFQLCSFTSPAIDLIFALYHFVSAANRERHRDDFISIYHGQFVQSLNELGFRGNAPTLKSIHDELLRCGTFEVLVSVCLTIFYFFDMSRLTAEDLDMAEGTMRARIRMCRTEEYLKMVTYQLKEMRERGLL